MKSFEFWPMEETGRGGRLGTLAGGSVRHRVAAPSGSGRWRPAPGRWRRPQEGADGAGALATPSRRGARRDPWGAFRFTAAEIPVVLEMLNRLSSDVFC